MLPAFLRAARLTAESCDTQAASDRTKKGAELRKLYAELFVRQAQVCLSIPYPSRRTGVSLHLVPLAVYFYASDCPRLGLGLEEESIDGAFSPKAAISSEANEAPAEERR